MTLKRFKEILLTLSPEIKIFHNFADGDGNYIVWREVAKKRLVADGVTAESALRIAVDYFTQDEYDAGHERLERLFDETGVCFKDPAVIYERDAGLMHYAYTVEV